MLSSDCSYNTTQLFSTVSINFKHNHEKIQPTIIQLRFYMIDSEKRETVRMKQR